MSKLRGPFYFQAGVHLAHLAGPRLLRAANEAVHALRRAKDAMTNDYYRKPRIGMEEAWRLAEESIRHLETAIEYAVMEVK